MLFRSRAHYPLSLHGVGLSLGSTDPLDAAHLQSLKRLVDRYEPALVSEHLSFGAVAGVHYNDLLPLPYTRECADHLVARIGAVQDELKRPILVENASCYLRYRVDEMDEVEFVVDVARRAGCGVLLDINNIYVNARNHGLDARQYLARMPVDLVGEFHLAGHSVNVHDGREIQAVLLGGAAGSFVRGDELDLPLTFEAVREAKTTLGSGVVMVFDDRVDLHAILLRIAQFFRNESCGQCVPCRVGTVRQQEALARLANGTPRETVEQELALIADIGNCMRDASICGLGQAASSAVESAIGRLGVYR